VTFKTAIRGLRAYLNGGEAVDKYFVQGKGEIRLSKTDFKAQGGEGSIYVKGSTAYKIYADQRRAIPQAKILELAALARPNIIRPLDVLHDGQGRPAGYSMRAVGPSYALCQLFPKAFRQRNNLSPETALRLVRRLQEGVRHVHARGILIVDLNEMNFLVAEDFGEIFFIDVDSYQTASFPATVLMESVRDRHARSFTTLSDWFSFAVVSFQLFVGIHPFKGSYPPLQHSGDKESALDARMRANVSVLRAGVSVPASCLPFSVIPPAYLDWYKAVFEEGKRLPPPEGAQPALNLAAPAARPPVESDQFEVAEIHEYAGDIIRHDGSITVTDSSVFFEGREYPKPRCGAKVAATPRLRHLVAAFMGASGPRFLDLTDGRELPLGASGEEVALHEGQFYVKQGENIFAVELMERQRSILPGLKPVANVMMNSTRLFEGVAIQSLLGAYYAALFPAPGVCRQVRLRELDGYRVLEARLCRNVLVIVAVKGGRYDKFTLRFADDFGGYDLRLSPDVSSTNINLTVLDSGVVLQMTDDDGLEVFSRVKDSPGMKIIRDPFLRSDVRLFHVGAQALAARGGKLYKIKMRQGSAQPSVE
jgi:hypothetical protein